MIFVNNQLDAQFFMYVYFYSLHVSGSHVPIIRRIIVLMQRLVYITLCRRPSGMQVSTCNKHVLMIFVNNQLDAQLFMYIYFYSVHVSDSHMPIIKRIVVSMRRLVYVTLCRWPSGMQEHMLLHTRRSSKQMSHWYNHSPDDGTWLPETCRE